MAHTIQEFLAHEQYEVQNNIDRMKHSLKGESPDNPRLSGEFTMLAVQEQHLEFIDKLSQQITTYEEAIELCREYTIETESAHMQIARTEDHQHGLHSKEWWNTLHRMEFYSDFLDRIKVWHKNHTTAL